MTLWWLGAPCTHISIIGAHFLWNFASSYGFQQHSFLGIQGLFVDFKGLALWIFGFQSFYHFFPLLVIHQFHKSTRITTYKWPQSLWKSITRSISKIGRTAKHYWWKQNREREEREKRRNGTYNVELTRCTTLCLYVRHWSTRSTITSCLSPCK